MRKTVKLTDKLLAELEKHGNVLNACSKVGIGTSTYYRWCKDDLDFKGTTESSIEIGRLNVTDLAESKLIQNISKGDQRAIEFHLKSNNPRYVTALTRKQMNEQMEEFRKKNDISRELGYLEYLITNLFSMYTVDDIRQKLMELKRHDNESLENHPDGDGTTMNEFVQSLIDICSDDIKAIEGTQKKRPSWGTRMHDQVCGLHANPDEAAKYGDVQEKLYKEERRNEIRKWNIERGIPPDEGIDF